MAIIPLYSKSFVKDNAGVIVGHILIAIKGFILMPVIIKTVGITAYGGFVLLSSILSIVFGISTFGAGFRAQRFLPSTSNITTRRELFYCQFFFQMFSILFLSLLFFLLNRQVNVNIFNNEISYSAWIIPLYLISYTIYSQGSLYLRYTSRTNYMIIANISFAYINIGLILLYYYNYNFMSIDMLFISQILAATIIAVPCFTIIFREIGIEFTFYSMRNLISDIKIGFPLVLNFIVDFILAASDRYLIALYLTVSSVGYYNPGYVLGSFIVLIPKAMGTVLPQLMSKAVDNKNENEAQRMLNYSLKIFLLLAIPFIFGTIVFGKRILTLLANREIAENAYVVTSIVALGALFYGLYIIISNVLFVRMKTFAMFKINLSASLFNLLANLIFLYFFKNIIVTAFTTFFSYFIAFMYAYKIVKKDWSMDFQSVVIIKSVLASLFMGCFLFWISFNSDNNDSISMLISEIVLGIVIYFGALLVLKTFSTKELAFFLNKPKL
ncbi:lipopolysaccharide biosynthesis protein [bacterium]|nr:lipopolysaccharide biosynthesis protein [bacterium]